MSYAEELEATAADQGNIPGDDPSGEIDGGGFDNNGGYNDN